MCLVLDGMPVGPDRRSLAAFSARCCIARSLDAGAASGIAARLEGQRTCGSCLLAFARKNLLVEYTPTRSIRPFIFLVAVVAFVASWAGEWQTGLALRVLLSGIGALTIGPIRRIMFLHLSSIDEMSIYERF